jgi:hypothetical protein
MKKIAVSLILFFCNSYGQAIDSSRLDYFPLHKGDTWQYGFSKYPSGPQPPFPPFFVSVVDTLLSNGRRYAGLSKCATPNKVYKLLRVDSLLRVQEYFPGLGDSCGGVSAELNTYRLGEKDSAVWSVCTNMDVSLFPNKSLIRFNRITADSTIMEFQIGLPDPSHPLWTNPFRLTRGVGITATNDNDGGDTYLTGAIINGKQIGNPILLADDKPELPIKYCLTHNYPNPFNPYTSISYSIPSQSHVTIKVFNSIGQIITILVNEVKPAGRYITIWNGSQYSSGVYFYQMWAGTFSQTNNMVLTK